jgi:hypothetical protein
MTFSRRTNSTALFLALLMAAVSISGKLAAQDTPDDQPAASDAASEAAPPTAEKKSDLVRLDKESHVWIDLKRKIVVVDGKVCLREGQLEMFACPRSTKEHESVVAVESKAYVIHAALLAVGAEVGRPVKFAPEYVPASGTEIEVYVLWVDENGKRHKARAQEWIRQVKTGKPMPYTWVFAGSGFWKDDLTGERHYMAEDGDLICVSNFATATMDLPVESSQSNDGLMFDAFTDSIPPLGTKVRLVLIPKVKRDVAAGDEGPENVSDGDDKDDAKATSGSAASGSTD